MKIFSEIWIRLPFTCYKSEEIFHKANIDRIKGLPITLESFIPNLTKFLRLLRTFPEKFFFFREIKEKSKIILLVYPFNNNL